MNETINNIFGYADKGIDLYNKVNPPAAPTVPVPPPTPSEKKSYNTKAIVIVLGVVLFGLVAYKIASK